MEHFDSAKYYNNKSEKSPTDKGKGDNAPTHSDEHTTMRVPEKPELPKIVLPGLLELKDFPVTYPQIMYFIGPIMDTLARYPSVPLQSVLDLLGELHTPKNLGPETNLIGVRDLPETSKAFWGYALFTLNLNSLKTQNEHIPTNTNIFSIDFGAPKLNVPDETIRTFMQIVEVMRDPTKAKKFITIYNAYSNYMSGNVPLGSQEEQDLYQTLVKLLSEVSIDELQPTILAKNDYYEFGQRWDALKVLGEMTVSHIYCKLIENGATNKEPSKLLYYLSIIDEPPAYLVRHALCFFTSYHNYSLEALEDFFGLARLKIYHLLGLTKKHGRYYYIPRGIGNFSDLIALKNREGMYSKSSIEFELAMLLAGIQIYESTLEKKADQNYSFSSDSFSSDYLRKIAINPHDNLSYASSMSIEQIFHYVTLWYLFLKNDINTHHLSTFFNDTHKGKKASFFFKRLHARIARLNANPPSLEEYYNELLSIGKSFLTLCGGLDQTSKQ